MAAAAGRLHLGDNRRAFFGSKLSQPCGNVVGRTSFFEPMYSVADPAETAGHTRQLSLNIGWDVACVPEVVRQVRFQN
jgi:hypothetical protein